MCTGIDGVERSFQSWIVRRDHQNAGRRNRHRPGSSTNRYAGDRIDGLERGLRFLEIVVLLDAVLLRQRERDRAHGQKQKQVKCALNDVRFNVRVGVCFIFGFFFDFWFLCFCI